MVEDLVKVFATGGYPLVLVFFVMAACVALWRDRTKTRDDILKVTQDQHAAQMKAIEILTEILTKVDKCDRTR